MEKKVTILAVDDEREVLTFLANILKRGGYEVLTAACGREALKLAVQKKPNLIILDIILPDISGGEVLTMLSGNAATKTIPVVFLSGLNTAEDEAIIRQKTGDYHSLAKPVTPDNLLETVRRVLSESA